MTKTQTLNYMDKNLFTIIYYSPDWMSSWLSYGVHNYLIMFNFLNLSVTLSLKLLCTKILIFIYILEILLQIGELSGHLSRREPPITKTTLQLVTYYCREL